MGNTTEMHVPVLHHVNLKTTRLQEMIDWYGLTIGLTPVHQFASGAWLTNDEANHRLALLAPPGLRDDPDRLTRSGLHHTAYEYETLDELLDTYQRLAPQGILPHACLDHGMTISFYYVDPDGNSLELQADSFGDWEQSKAFMLEDPAFEADPIGVSVDPALMAAARDQGATSTELHQRAVAREFEPDEPLDLRIALG